MEGIILSSQPSQFYLPVKYQFKVTMLSLTILPHGFHTDYIEITCPYCLNSTYFTLLTKSAKYMIKCGEYFCL